MTLLSLDLGITTGWAIFYDESDHDWDEAGNRNIDHLLDFLVECKSAHDDLRVVVEDPIVIRGPLGDNLRKALDIVDAVFPRAAHVDPARWKQTPWASFTLPRGKLTPHQRDAIRLGLWYLSQPHDGG